MSVKGTYTIEMSTPMGNRAATLLLKDDNDSLSGTLTDDQGENKFEGGTASGDEFSFKVQVSTPMGNIELTVSGAVNDNSISGEVQAGQFGSFAFKGARA